MRGQSYCGQHGHSRLPGMLPTHPDRCVICGRVRVEVEQDGVVLAAWVPPESQEATRAYLQEVIKPVVDEAWRRMEHLLTYGATIEEAQG